MLFSKALEIDQEHYEPTKEVLIKNGNRVSEQFHGSRRILYSNNLISGYSQTDHYLPMSEDLTNKQFYSFLSSFRRSLYKQIEKNNDLLAMKITFEGQSRDKNRIVWNKLKNRSIFYTIDLTSAYWQFAYRLGYISKKTFNSYIDKPEYKEAKRYAVSFLARENEMYYYDGREIDHVQCDIGALYQVYDNIRNEMYRSIGEVIKLVPNWIEYNIDSISVTQKDLNIVTQSFDKMNLMYKVEEAVKVDSKEYCIKGKFRKF